MSKEKIDLGEGSNVGITSAASIKSVYKNMLSKATEYKGYTTVLGNVIDENMLNILRFRIDQLKNAYSIQYGSKGRKSEVPTAMKVMRNQMFYRKDIWNEKNENLLKVSESTLLNDPDWINHPENHIMIKLRKQKKQ